MLCRGLVAQRSQASLRMLRVGAAFSSVELALAHVEFGHFDQVGHQVVELLGFFDGAVGEMSACSGLSSPPKPWARA